MAVTNTKSTVIEIEPIKTQTVIAAIRGISPLLMHRMSEKAKHELLLPRGKKTAAEKASTLKHDPMAEYRSSAHIIADTDSPTLLGVPSSAIKNAMMTAALRVPGAQKTQIAQMVWIEGDMTPVYGIPEIHGAVVRMADINRTPDIRFRAVVPEWAAIVSISFMSPMLNERSILNLLSGAGQVSGLGEMRRQKGGSYGAFVVTDPEQDETFKRIIETSGRIEQAAALDEPDAYDAETQELLSWYDNEIEQRGIAA